jgi:hypothetical protein
MGVPLDSIVRTTSFVSYVTWVVTPAGAVIETFAKVVPFRPLFAVNRVYCIPTIKGLPVSVTFKFPSSPAHPRQSFHCRSTPRCGQLGQLARYRAETNRRLERFATKWLGRSTATARDIAAHRPKLRRGHTTRWLSFAVSIDGVAVVNRHGNVRHRFTGSGSANDQCDRKHCYYCFHLVFLLGG